MHGGKEWPRSFLARRFWQEEPYGTTAATTGGCYHGVTILGTPVVCSTVIADNPLSEWQGSQMGVGPTSHFDIPLINGAGGAFKIAGDYLFRTHQSFQFDKGVWGILRVTPSPVVPPPKTVTLLP